MSYKGKSKSRCMEEVDPKLMKEFEKKTLEMASSSEKTKKKRVMPKMAE